jgi:hypothetical protein
MFPTALLAVAALIVVAAYIAQPFFGQRAESGGAGAGRRLAPLLREQSDLLEARNQVYREIRDLDFDYKTNKVSDVDYNAQRYQLVARGVEILQGLDALPAFEDTPDYRRIEQAVLAVRRGAEAAPPPQEDSPPSGTGYCPQCGAPFSESDRFCGTCGARLPRLVKTQ